MTEQHTEYSIRITASQMEMSYTAKIDGNSTTIEALSAAMTVLGGVYSSDMVKDAVIEMAQQLEAERE